jgi:hypothetical protein
MIHVVSMTRDAARRGSHFADETAAHEAVGVSGASPWWDEAFATAIAKQRHAESVARGALAAG